MIYRLYYDSERKDEPDRGDRYCEFLLGYALLQEKQLHYRDLTVIRNAWGKPALKDHPQIQYNASHCRGLVSCVLADVPVGIDVEYVRPHSPHAASHALCPQEMEDVSRAEDPDRQFFIYWTLKESCVKAIGMGLAYSMKKVAFRINGTDIQCLTLPEYRFTLFENAGPYITAACYREGGRSLRVYESK